MQSGPHTSTSGSIIITRTTKITATTEISRLTNISNGAARTPLREAALLEAARPALLQSQKLVDLATFLMTAHHYDNQHHNDLQIHDHGNYRIE